MNALGLGRYRHTAPQGSSHGGSSDRMRAEPSKETAADAQAAARRLSARSGQHYILPSPEHVTFARRVPHGQAQSPLPGSVVRLAGEITTPGGLCDIFALLGQVGWRGELRVYEDKTERGLYFEDGNIVGARTNHLDERLGAVMYRFGVLSSEDLEDLEGALGLGKRIGEVAVTLGFVTREQVYAALKHQIEEIAMGVLTVSDGTFYFLDGFDEEGLTSRQMIGCNALLMDAVTRMEEIRYFRERIPSADYVPMRLSGACEAPADLAVTYGSIDGQLSVADLGRLTGKGEFGVTKDLFALAQSHNVSLRPPPLRGGLHALAREANTALALLYDHVAEFGQTSDLTDSLRAFVAGTGIFELIFAEAGPGTRGELDPERLVANAQRVAAADGTAATLGRMLYEYVNFASFVASAQLPSAQQAAIGRALRGHLSRLRGQPCQH